MGVGYQASPFHHIAFMVVDDDAPYTTEPPPDWRLPPLPGARFMLEPLRLRSPAVAEIIAWRDRLAATAADRLGERLTWDEASDFWAAEDAATSDELMFRYVAAVAQEGGVGAVRDLVDRHTPGHRSPEYEALRRTFDNAVRRGLAGPFPQLLLASNYWLPFRRRVLLQEPDWEGRMQRFGSTYRLAEEVQGLRALIADADPRAVDRDPDQGMSTNILWSAWQASEPIARVCAAAVSRHLPMCSTG